MILNPRILPTVAIFSILAVAFTALVSFSKFTGHSGKYGIYVNDEYYETNNFRTYGNGIVFEDTNGHKVFINGTYVIVNNVVE